MYLFYFFLWLRWGIRVTLCSVILALLSSFLLTFFIYIKQGLPSLSEDVFMALLNIAKFWFPLTWSITLFIALFRSLKYIFNNKIKGYQLQLFDCSSQEFIEEVGYGDLVKVWRKWFMSMIWIVSTLMLLTVSLTYLLSSYKNIFEWFSIYILFLFILIAGYISLVLLAGRCKNVKIIKC